MKTIALIFFLAWDCAAQPTMVPAPSSNTNAYQQAMTTQAIAAVSSMTNTPDIVPIAPTNTLPIITWQIMAPGGSGPMSGVAPSSWILLQGSSNLIDWHDLGHSPDAAGSYAFTDTNAAPCMFYRVMAIGSCQMVTNAILVPPMPFVEDTNGP